jgi:Family of unknown function (DUF6454)
MVVRLGRLIAAAGALALTLPAAQTEPALVARVKQITRTTVWTRADAIPVAFRTFHPQGMVRIGDTFFVTSVDKEHSAGHLFKIDKAGQLLADLPLGEGAIYHPGGIDYDGRFIWVPVAEYRPDSRAIVYRVDPAAMKATEVFRFADHLGAIVHDTDDDTLHAVSWGSRRFYRWPLDASGRVVDPGAPAALARRNPSHYVDYQDCHYAGGHFMLCGGVTEIRQPASAPFRLGGLEIVDLAAARAVHQVPVPLWTPGGRVMTENPLWLEATPSGVRAYFMPEDDRSTIYVYDLKSIS